MKDKRPLQLMLERPLSLWLGGSVAWWFGGLVFLNASSEARFARHAQECIEQWRAVQQLVAARAMKLRMPLHAHHERRAPVSNGFNDPVRRRYRLNIHIAADRPDCLMVDRVDERFTLPRKHVDERGAIGEANRMTMLVVLLIDMDTGSRDIGGNVLIQRAAESHIDELTTAAHAKHRLYRIIE